MIAGVRRLLAFTFSTSALLVSLPACVTGGADETESQAGAVDDPELAPASPSRLELGQIADEDLRQIIYQGLEARLAKTQAVGENAEEVTELGDYDSFRFAIVKLTRGHDDVSADPSIAPDGMDVEVTGWFKRTITGDDEQKPACTSFDARVTLLKVEGDWRFSDEHPVTFGREDPEDCY